MALTQEAILNTLLEGKGKMKNSDLLFKFKELLNCSDPAEKKQNRDLFKTFVNNIAVVKDFPDAKYIVLRKVYKHLLKASNKKTHQMKIAAKMDHIQKKMRRKNPPFPKIQKVRCLQTTAQSSQ